MRPIPILEDPILSFEEAKALNGYFSEMLSESRRRKIEEVLSFRTKYLTIVLEDVFQPFNASATLRTSECLGLSDVYVVENRNSYKPNSGVAMGAQKWLRIHKYQDKNEDNTSACLGELKSAGYRIVATSPRDGEGLRSLEDLPLDRPTALLIGAEEIGLSERALAQADLHLKLPMYGFTESYNLSVTVAIVLSNLLPRIRAVSEDWRLSEEDTAHLRNFLYKKTINNGPVIESEFLRRRRRPI
ncbi:TrmH family RNA methyltransferase [Leptospira fluminis]|uniref:tRNA (guanosine(18)-2'-O)-methyltransferase n=1 Tax=Leptospira fluminis TaxID=2484979 RepID=A0A4R9GNF3_9LEPT|nr:RNA methyltransferase [Leptospira fluminis]TGK17381.1 TrmH family RNA methyltransferase [Leptospira fluminis]